MSLDLKLRKVDRIYRPGDIVSGTIVVSCKGGMSHNGISLVVNGEVTLQLSAKSVGYFEAFYKSLQPVQLLSYTMEVSKADKLPDGTTEIPFEFPLTPIEGQSLYETYHGVYVNVQYYIQCDLAARTFFSKSLQKKLEFIVEAPSDKSKIPKEEKVPFSLAPDILERKSEQKLPAFKLSGYLTSATCNIASPFTGEVVIESCDAVIKSLELQLVRVETCGCAEGFAKEATEIQNIQIGDGDVCRGLRIPIYMIFPRLFTCPTLGTKTFKIEFEVNIVLMFEDNTLVTKNFPIRLVRL